MKIAIHTISDDNNFGNRLQNYALQNILNKKFAETYTLQDINSEDNYYSLKNEIKWTTALLPVRAVFSFVKYRNSLIVKQNVTWWMRQILFRKFTKKYVPKFNDKNVNKEIDVFVIGSDQIWNPKFRKNVSDDFLPDIRNKTIISYAASIGIDNLNKSDETKFKEGLNNLHSISVREYSAKKIIENYTDTPVTVLIDPTMLLSADDWRKLSKNANKVVKSQNSFLITYFLGEMSESEKTYINQFAQINNLQIINISDKNNPLYGKIGPLEFLWLFDNASAVFADSFHAAVFSLIFQKYFEIFERHDSLSPMNTRMHTLFDHFSLGDRMHNVDQNPNRLPDVDYDRISKIIEAKQEEAFDWLDKNLKKRKN